MGVLQPGAVAAAVLLVAVPINAVATDESTSPVTGFCCPGGDHGLELQSTGLGQSHPMAVDSSLDPAWRVYGFQRDGVEYFQVNDLAGQVQLIVGNLDGHFWTLPAGESSTRVVLPPRRMAAPQIAVRSEVFRHPKFSLIRYGMGDRAQWSIELSNAVR